MLNKYGISSLLVISFLIISCANNKPKNVIADDSMVPVVNSKQKDSTPLEFADNTIDAGPGNRDTLSPFKGSKLKTDDFIKQYPTGQKAPLRNYIESLRKEWQNVPNPIIAAYEGNDFGDYHHLLFKDKNGVTYDFGQANNSYGPYKLHKLSGQYEDNPEFLGKKFNIYWDWKLSDFFCCDGEYGKAKAYLPSITKLELIKK